MVAPGVSAGFDGDEAVAPLAVGQAAAGTVEVGVERSVMAIDVVAVAARSVRLPDLDEAVADGPSVLIEQSPADDDPLPGGSAAVLRREVVVVLPDRATPEHRACDRREPSRTPAATADCPQTRPEMDPRR